MMAVDLSALKFVTGKANDGGLLGKGGVVGESAGCQPDDVMLRFRAKL